MFRTLLKRIACIFTVLFMVISSTSLAHATEPTASSSASTREVIEINSKEDFINLWNQTVGTGGGVEYNLEQYGVYNKTINLNVNVVISSDEINEQLPGNTRYKNYTKSFFLINSDFHGNNKTVTITQGDRPIYSLFGEIATDEGQKSYIDNLTVNYEGDVYGSGFARNINQSMFGPSKGKCYINNIQVNVGKSILPLSDIMHLKGGAIIDATPAGTAAMAVGFADHADNVNISSVTLNVAENIGALEVTPFKDTLTDQMYQKYIEANPDKFHDIVYSSAVGFIYSSSGNQDYYGESFNDFNQIHLNIGGSILAKGIDSGADANGFGYSLGRMKMHDINVKVGHDISSTMVKGESGSPFAPYVGKYESTAGGFAHNFHYLDLANITVGGSIKVSNAVAPNWNLYAYGIDYLDDRLHGLDHVLPRTIKNVTVDVNGNVEVLAPLEGNFKPTCKAVAVGGAANLHHDAFLDMQNGTYSKDHFIHNSVNIHNDILVDTVGYNNYAYLWGKMYGKDNILKANNIISKTKGSRTKHTVASIQDVLKSENNTVELSSIQALGDGKSNVAGFAYHLAQAHDDHVKIGQIIADNVFQYGGFGYRVEQFDNRQDIKAEVYNETLNLNTKVIMNGVKQYGRIGGFVSDNYGSIHDCKADLEGFEVNNVENEMYLGGFMSIPSANSSLSNCELKMNTISITGGQSLHVGGFVSYNYLNLAINNCKAHLNNISVQTSGSANVGGFVGTSYDLESKNCATLVDQSIIVDGANDPNVGGFVGYSSNNKLTNCAAQVGGDITARNSAGNGNVGGFVGDVIENNIEECTSLVFGNIEGDSSDSIKLGGFAGYLDNGEDSSTVKKCAAYVGGTLPAQSNKVMRGGVTPFIQQGSIDNFTLLINKDALNQSATNGPSMLTANDYVHKISNSNVDISNPHVVIVDGGKRTAYNADIDKTALNNVKTTLKSNPVNEIEIAGRDFQNKFWGAQANSEFVPGEFDYVKDSKGLSLTPYTPYTPDEENKILVNSGVQKLKIDNFNDRHLSILNDGITYDILGIKSGDAPEPEPKPDHPTVSTTLTVTFNSKGGTDVQTQYLDFGDKAIRPKDPVKDGYEFDGWYIEKEILDDLHKIYPPRNEETQVLFDFDTRISKDITLYAKWKPIEKPVVPQKPDDHIVDSGDPFNPLMAGMVLVSMIALAGYSISKLSYSKH